MDGVKQAVTELTAALQKQNVASNAKPQPSVGIDGAPQRASSQTRWIVVFPSVTTVPCRGGACGALRMSWSSFQRHRPASAARPPTISKELPNGIGNGSSNVCSSREAR